MHPICTPFRVSIKICAQIQKNADTQMGICIFCSRQGLEQSNATVRGTVAGDGSTEPNLNFRQRRKCKRVPDEAGVKKCPGDTFLARGRVPGVPNASRRGVGGAPALQKGIQMLQIQHAGGVLAARTSTVGAGHRPARRKTQFFGFFVGK